MTNNRINETGNRYAVQNIANEIAATNHRAGSNGRAGIGKCELENPVRQNWNTCRAIQTIRAAPCRVKPLQEETVRTNEGCTRLEHEGIAPRPEGQTADTGISNTF